jgi:2-keto-4-pentenoate hydratase/2-oxohepta-3-ene-1,7-dioic acid hydratase in catechol pathway
MKIVRFTTPGGDAPPVLGLLNDAGTRVANLARAYARLLESLGDSHAAEAAALRFGGDVAQMLGGGAPAHDALMLTADYLSGGGADDELDGRPLATNLDKVHLLAPIRPPKMIAVGRNYSAHLAEMRGAAPVDMQVPSAWIKANSCICGPNDDIIKPHMTTMLDYETELSVVIGTRCKNVPEDRAYDVIAGYTIVNDISARDIARIERKEQNQLLGKMFDTFAPMGPCFVTKDEIADPMDLALRTRVNGESRQDGRTSGMIWTIPQQIAYLSQMTLDAGDVILTGTPSGVASGHKVEGENWFLQDGDVLESELEGIGTMRNTIRDAAERETSWTW